MGYIQSAVGIQELGQRNFWTVYGRSGCGKTHFGATFPKPQLYIQLGDDGSNTIAETEGVYALRLSELAEQNKKTPMEVLKALIKELRTDKKYKSVFVDTFSLLTNEWQEHLVTGKNKKMTQQAWGDLKIDTETLIKELHSLALKKIVLVSCHEASDVIEGMEDEIVPEIRASVTKGARTYLEGMSNYGVHLTKVKKTVQTQDGEKDVVRYAAHIGANPYYWTKFQIEDSIKLPSIMINPSYSKIMRIIGGK